MCEESEAVFYPSGPQTNQDLLFNCNNQDKLNQKCKIQQEHGSRIQPKNRKNTGAKDIHSKIRTQKTSIDEEIKHQQHFENDGSKKQKKHKPKSSDPSEQDLCEAILLIKKQLPTRSLERIIKRLFERVEQKQKREQANKILKNNAKIQEQSADKDQNFAIASQKLSKSSDNHSEFDKTTLQPRTDKVVLAGRKASCYHDNAGQIAALSHQFYKANTPTVQELETIQNNLAKLPIYSKSRPQTIAIPEQNVQRSAINHENRRNIIFHFKQSQTLKTQFHNPSLASTYKKKQELTRTYLQRGLGITKKIDNELPKMNISLRKYRLSLVCIVTEAYRRLESFLSKECQRTIKYINQEQMRSIHSTLIHCRVNLEPNSCQTFFKFLRICFGLGDVSISDDQAIELYVNIQRHLFGKNTSMETLQHMGRISNRRQLQNVVKQLSQRAAYDQYRNSKVGSSKYDLSLLNQSVFEEKKQDCINNSQIKIDYDAQDNACNIRPFSKTKNKKMSAVQQNHIYQNNQRDQWTEDNANFDFQCSDLMINNDVKDESTNYLLPDYNEFANSPDWYSDLHD